MMGAVDRLRTSRAPIALAVVGTLLALATLGVAAWFLADTQSKQRRDLRDRYSDRTVVAASLIDALFRVAFDGQAQFYRKAWLKWADVRKPEVRAARIVELVQLLKAGHKSRPR